MYQFSQPHPGPERALTRLVVAIIALAERESDDTCGPSASSKHDGAQETEGCEREGVV